MRFIVIVFFISAIGCAHSPARIAMLDAEELKKEKLSDLCITYGTDYYSNERIKNELIRRSAISEFNWKYVNKETVIIGMNRCALMAVLGRPSYVNRSSHGPDQWVYRKYGMAPAFIYVQGDTVVAWQGSRY